MTHDQPFVVEVLRGDLVESRHRGIGAVVDARGTVIHAWGDTGCHIYPRSAIKPLQAIPLIESGAADAYSLSESELALACASHNGERTHTDAVAAVLARIGCDPQDLECGAHRLYDMRATDELVRAQEEPTRLVNNCSGKHAGFLATARHLGEPTTGYSGPDHPVQERLLAVLEAMGETNLKDTERGIDGCGIPVMGMPLADMALALARMADPSGLAATRREACVRIVRAMMAHPYNVAGRGRFDTLAMQAAPGRFVVKTGAEAVHAAIVPEKGLGVALKIEDGSKRASEVAMATILDRLGLIDGAAAAKYSPLMAPDVTNAAGDRVGMIRMADGFFVQAP